MVSATEAHGHCAISMAANLEALIRTVEEFAPAFRDLSFPKLFELFIL